MRTDYWVLEHALYDANQSPERERQVLEGLIAGQANKVIANVHGISPRTVEVYRANLMAKMEARSLSALIRMAILAQVAASSGRAPR